MATVVSGDFEWDGGKAEDNRTKHDVSFEEAASAFFDPSHVVLEDPRHDDRLWLLGFSIRGRLLLVVHAEAGPRTRIISARKVTRHEERIYRRT